MGQPNSPQGTGAAMDTIAKSMYDELERRFGAQGNELGEYRTFFQSITPLLDKLEKAPELVQAIIDGRIDKQLAQAVYENRVNIGDAQAVQQAHDTVTRQLGADGVKNISDADLTRLIEDKAQELRKEFEDKAELRDFESETQAFIKETPDFVDYASDISKWLDEHDITDIKVAYYAVKGQLSEGAARKAADQVAGERAKEVLGNASGGGTHSRYAPDGSSIVDRLISGRPNPNSFW